MQQWWAAAAPPMLDLGCGCGHSVLHLQQTFPQQRVLGADVSLPRLKRGGRLLPADGLLLQPGCGWLHGDAITLLRLLAAAGLHTPRVWLLYPNPWPKAGHLQRRWHAHPVFPDLLRVARSIHLRSNWALYVQEFASALQLHGWHSRIERIEPGLQPSAISLFERKYAASGHPLWQLEAQPSC